jgi:hypothetical protein
VKGKFSISQNLFKGKGKLIDKTEKKSPCCFGEKSLYCPLQLYLKNLGNSLKENAPSSLIFTSTSDFGQGGYILKSIIVIKKMNFPHTWDIFKAADFATAAPRAAGELGMEVAAQVRPNGRILDHFRVTLGGSKIVDVTAPMTKLMLVDGASPWKFRYQVWPRDIVVRRNMTTTAWINALDLLAEKKAWVEDGEGNAVENELVLETVGDGRAAIRFAVVIGEDKNMELNLHALPATAESLMGKPTFRG